MGRDIKGKELGTGISQRKTGIYSGRYVNRFGERKQLYDYDLKNLRINLAREIYLNSVGATRKNSKVTLSEWFERWIEIYKYDVIRENTKVRYKGVFRKHIEPFLGKMMINKIEATDVRLLLKRLHESGLEYETRNKVKTILQDMLDKAILEDYLYKNPCKGIKLVRNENKEMRVLTQIDQKAFFDCCKATFYDNLFIVAVTTGLRQGELCALTWEDIDLQNKLISVNKTLLYQKLENDDGKTFHLNPPKTMSSHRKVPITEQCYEALERQYLQMNIIMSRRSSKPDKSLGNLLFTTRYGTPINSQLMIEAIKRIINEINSTRDDVEQMEMFSAHCFRHTFATRCFESGIPPKTVQAFLGHKNLSMTMDLYTHVLNATAYRDIVKLEDILNRIIDTK